MKILNINYYQKNNTNHSTIPSNKKEQNYTSSDISFSGIHIGHSARNMFAKVAEKLNDGKTEATKFVEKAKNEIVTSLKGLDEDLTNFDGSIDAIGSKADKSRDFVRENYFFPARRIKQINNEEFAKKKTKLDEISGIVAEKDKVANENLETAKKMPEEAEKLRHSKVIERQEAFEGTESTTVRNTEQFGFKRIASYQKEKDLLNSHFIDLIKLEKSGEEVEIPGSVFFFGPTGNGKTTFARAFADETGCKLEEIIIKPKTRFSAKDEKDLMDTIIKKAELAEENFKLTKTRTIIYIDELEKLIDKSSSVQEEFTNFVKTCSEKYHCTLFGASNHPSGLGIDLKTTDIFPIRISIDPPDKFDSIEVFKHHLKDKTTGEIDYDFLADKLIEIGKERGGIYSNSQIRDIAKESYKSKNEKVTQDEIIKYIEKCMKEKKGPSIKWDVLDNFKLDTENYMPEKM